MLGAMLARHHVWDKGSSPDALTTQVARLREKLHRTTDQLRQATERAERAERAAAESWALVKLLRGVPHRVDGV